MKRKTGKANQGYLMNSEVIGRGDDVLDITKDGIVPYMDGYRILPLEVDTLEKIELVDKAFDAAMDGGWRCEIISGVAKPTLWQRVKRLVARLGALA